MTLETIALLEAMERQATPEGWAVRPVGRYKHHSAITRKARKDEYSLIERPALIHGNGFTPNNDADFIVAIRNNAPELLAMARWALENGYKAE